MHVYHLKVSKNQQQQQQKNKRKHDKILGNMQQF